MKKLFTILALLMAFMVNGFAGNYYVVGNLTKWTYQPSAEGIAAMALLEGTEDTYYADYTPAAGTTNYFCIADGDGTNTDWSDFNSDYRYSSAEANQNVTDGCYSVQLSKNGDRSLIINGDGTTTFRIMFVESTKMLTVTKVGLEYVVAGSFTPNGGEEEAGFFGTKWDASANSLTLQNDGTYAITFSNVELPVGKITYKVAKKDDFTVATAENKTKSITEEGTYDITFVFYVNNLDGPVCNAIKQGAKYRIYVKNMQTDEAPLLYYWDPSGSEWPGETLTNVTVEGDDDWFVYETEESLLKGRFTLVENSYDQAYASGNIDFNLANGDLYYYYYPNDYQAVLKDEALSGPATIYVRANSEDALKFKYWESPGFGIPENLTTESLNGVEWYVMKSYIPTVTGSFYTNSDDSTWGKTFNLVSGEVGYYFANLSNNVYKLDENYYLFYGTGSDAYTGADKVLMTADGQFKFTTTLDNTEGKSLYYMMVPASFVNGSEITDWNEVLFFAGLADGAEYFNVKFEEYANYPVITRTWDRWAVYGVNAKFDITFDFASMTWSSKPYVVVTAPDTDYITYSYSKSVGVNVGDAEAYIVTGAKNGEAVLTKLAENADIPANTGILLKGAKSYKIYGSAYGVETADVSDNLLIASGEDSYDITGTTGTYDYTAYILADGVDGVGFYIMQSEGNKTLAAHKAFLAIPVTTETPAPFFGFGGGDTTGINSVERGALSVEGCYTLDGRRVEQPTKGLYIINGKKVLVK